MLRRLKKKTDPVVMTIQNRYGTLVESHPNKGNAIMAALAYVDEWWDYEIPVTMAKSASPVERIRRYFQHVRHESVTFDGHGLSA